MPNFYKETARGNSTVRIDDSLYSNRELFLTTGIDPCSSSELIKQLMFLDRQEDSEITLYINSPGGDVVSGLAVYDFINTMKSPVRTVCIGTAASMGAIIFLAGKKREMLPHTRLMLHDPFFASNRCEIKKANEMKVELETLNEFRDELAEIVAKKTGKPAKKILEITVNDTYFTAKQAIEFGLATGIIKGAKEHKK